MCIASRGSAHQRPPKKRKNSDEDRRHRREEGKRGLKKLVKTPSLSPPPPPYPHPRPLHALNHEETDASAIKESRLVLVHEDGPPQEGREPQARVAIRLVLADDDGVRHGQQADHSGAANKLQNRDFIHVTLPEEEGREKREGGEREGRGEMTGDGSIEGRGKEKGSKGKGQEAYLGGEL